MAEHPSAGEALQRLRDRDMIIDRPLRSDMLANRLRDHRLDLKEVFADEVALTTWQRTVASQAGYLAVTSDAFLD